ncbi:Two-component system histidine kinase RacS [hydrothermal vent metagenome]|uniref:histidine kinase n=1 Tax=hydrothermal vent metagenome TaxID=652676 RepID=A0A1W1CM07_9ZZZZ
MLIATTALLGYIALINDKKSAIKQSIVLYENLHKYKACDTMLKEYLLRNRLTMVTVDKAKEIMSRGEQLITDKDIHKTMHDANIEIFVENEHYFYAYKADADMFYFVNETPMTPIPKYLAFGTFLLLVLLYFLYRYIKKSMQPLQILHKNIDKFSRGELVQKADLDANDEVAQVANAFCEAASTIDSLQKSRILFLRNIMHELKTPITRGKLITHTLDESVEDKAKLLETFNAMERQLKELSDIEAITSKAQALDIKEYALIDIVENVYDILYFDEVVSHISNEIVKVDFNLFSVALKNLLDNARKYKTPHSEIELEYKEGVLSVSNYGEAFTQDINKFFEPFIRDCVQEKTEGFGLGLYIINEVVHRHNFELKYEYLKGKHIFQIIM